MKKQKKLLNKAKNKNEIAAHYFYKAARKNLKGFLEMFKNDQADKLDFDKGYELLDDEMKNYVPQNYLQRKDAFNLFVKAHLKTGGSCRFLIHAIFDMDRGEINVGIADVPDEPLFEPKMEMDDEDIEEMALNLLKQFTAKIKSGELKRPDDNTPNCSRCGRSDLPLTITIDATNLKTQKLCSVCLQNGGVTGEKSKKKSVEHIDKEIEELEALSIKYEELIKNQPVSDDLPPALARFAITPMSNYKSIQAMLADLRAQRMAAMTTMESQIRLEYELKKAIEEEDYEKSAELRDKLNRLTNK
jgi:hypothetical protein